MTWAAPELAERIIYVVVKAERPGEVRSQTGPLLPVKPLLYVLSDP